MIVLLCSLLLLLENLMELSCCYCTAFFPAVTSPNVCCVHSLFSQWTFLLFLFWTLIISTFHFLVVGHHLVGTRLQTVAPEVGCIRSFSSQNYFHVKEKKVDSLTISVSKGMNGNSLLVLKNVSTDHCWLTHLARKHRHTKARSPQAELSPHPHICCCFSVTLHSISPTYCHPWYLLLCLCGCDSTGQVVHPSVLFL